MTDIYDAGDLVRVAYDLERQSQMLLKYAQSICSHKKYDGTYTVDEGYGVFPETETCRVCHLEACYITGWQESKGIVKRCEDCSYPHLAENLITKSDHHGGSKTVCSDRKACHKRSPWSP